MKTIRLTTAQAIIGFLKNQSIERDGREHLFFSGVWGILGHGNLAGLGQALQQNLDFPFYPSRNEQAQVHLAVAYAKMNNRMKAFACTSSIGPGATNMLTGAATATINRLPVLLMPGDIFARRNVAPVLQQLEQSFSQDVSVNDCFKPVSRYWDRINRPDQILCALPEVMRVLTSPSETGAVTLALPQDVQTEACDYPVDFFRPRTWTVPRPAPDPSLFQRSLEWIRSSKKPLIIAGGGVHYSEACQALSKLAALTGIPVAETQAGKGALAFDHPQEVGAMGVTGTPVANQLAREADLIIGIGTRYSDFTTASKTAFQNPQVRFINVNIAEFDSFKHGALPLTGDARVVIESWLRSLKAYRVSSSHASKVAQGRKRWDKEVDRLYHLGSTGLPAQSEVIGALNEHMRPKDVILNAAGSAPGDLHKLWQTRESKGYHMEYGYSCMGYEIPASLGIKMADPSREVYAIVGDGTFLMMPTEIVTSIQEGVPVHLILINNHGFASIGGLSGSIGSKGFGTVYRCRNPKTGQLDGDILPVDYASCLKGLGAQVLEARTLEEFKKALKTSRSIQKTTAIVVHVDPDQRVPGYDSWWDVAIAEVSEMEGVKKARQEYEKKRKTERMWF